MNGEARLIDTDVLVHAYTVSDDEKHRAALTLIEGVWSGEGATTTLQNLCEFFFVATRKVEKPISASTGEAIVKGIMAGSHITENERDFRRIPGIAVVNPFRAKAKR